MNTIWDNLLPLFKEAISTKSALTPYDITFAEGTYQILFPQVGGDRPCVVLQVQGEPDESQCCYVPQDIFCSSCDSSSSTHCIHQAAAYSWITNFGLAPPHIFFSSTPWKTLFESICDQHGYDDFIVARDGKWLNFRKKKKEVFFRIQADEFLLSHIEELFTRPVETEETSIKFSIFDEVDLERYRSGRPNRKVRFELSHFSDLSQLLSRFEQMQGLKATFSDGKVSLGKAVQIEYTCDTDRDRERLNAALLELSYSFHGIDEKSGNWKFQIGGKKALLSDEAKIALLTDLLAHSLPRKIDTLQISTDPVALSYSAEVTPTEVIIEAYRLKKGDLKNAAWYGRWAVLGSTIFPVEPPPFAPFGLHLKGKEVAAFIRQYPHFLQSFPTLQIHVAPVEESISYQVDASGSLKFTAKATKQETSGTAYEFGSYQWVKGKGFYPKERAPESRVFPVGKTISPYQVADFIRTHKEHLDMLPGFFAKKSPLKHAGLKVSLSQKDLITIEVVLDWKPTIDADAIRMYDEFGYSRDVGFFAIPNGQTLFTQERTIVAGDQEEWDHFLSSGLNKLKSEIACEIDPKLMPPQSLTLVATNVEEGDLKQKDLQSLWKMNLVWESEKGTVTLAEVYDGKSRGQRFLPSKAGLLDITLDRFAWLDMKKQKRKKEATEKPLELTSLDLIRLHAHDTIQFKQDATAYAPVELIERLLQMKAPTPPDTSLLNCNLRPYQEYGLHWLWYLYSNRLSGLLCDDMGVGKTHQAMALLASVKADAVKNDKPVRFLVVCPTSLVWHWKEKLKVFIPSLSVLPYFGSTRGETPIDGAEVFLTTYGIWRNERKQLQKLEFDVAVFDELQIAKNHSSLIWAALSDVSAKMRLGLTGTPIENQLRELKALFDLILPGYMPDDYGFRELFVRPIERGAGLGRTDLLGKYVRPFILRRRKQDVLQDLPQKSEELCHAELIGDQKSLYRSVAAQHSASLLSALRDESSHVPYMHIFALLSALKQISNHPSTYLKDIDNYEKYESGKWAIFTELLEEAQESGHKVVVFSQYLSMLDIMIKHLDSKGIGYAQIRGQTKRRGVEIDRFQTDPECRVFLGSLQAAGLGIDLTAGSIVIHYDRWWNAARENQATDRVHRIGQESKVQVYKLVTLNSIEEQIDRMIMKKATLLEDVVSWDDHQVVKRLSRSELIELLEGLQ